MSSVIKCRCGMAFRSTVGECPFCGQCNSALEFGFEFDVVTFFNGCEDCCYGNGKGEKRRCSVKRAMCVDINENCLVKKLKRLQ